MMTFLSISGTIPFLGRNFWHDVIDQLRFDGCFSASHIIDMHTIANIATATSLRDTTAL